MGTKRNLSKLLSIIGFISALIMLTLIGSQKVHAQTNVTPVIDDQLHTLTNEQEQQIDSQNERLMAKRNHQQIWVITTDVTPQQLSAKTDDEVDLDSEDIQDFGGLSVEALQDYGNDIYDYYLDKYAGATDEKNDYWSQRKYTDVANKVNILVVDPNFKYHVIPLFSETSTLTIGDWRNFVLTHQFRFGDDSQQGIMTNYQLFSRYLTNKATGRALNNGPDVSEMVFWELVIIIVIAIVIWLIKRHNYHGPKRTSFWDSGGDAKYDNGFMDGWYFGDNNGDDTFKD